MAAFQAQYNDILAQEGDDRDKDKCINSGCVYLWVDFLGIANELDLREWEK